MINLFLIFLIIGAGITSQTLANEIKYDKERGKYLFNISGCKNCHTQKKDGNKLPAGGVRIKTPFGIFMGQISLQTRSSVLVIGETWIFLTL